MIQRACGGGASIRMQASKPYQSPSVHLGYLPTAVMLRYGSVALILLHWMHITTASGLQVYSYRYPPGQYWHVEGLATWIKTNSFSQSLDCNTTSNSGDGVGWSREGGLNPSRVQAVANGKRLSLDIGFTNADLGIYTCYDSATNESLNVSITNANPAIQAVSDVVTIEAGSSGQLKVYVSGIPNPNSTDIAWFKVGPGGSKTELKEPTVNFSSDHHTLLLTNVNESDGGTYLCNVNPAGGLTANVTIHMNVMLSGRATVPTNVTMPTNATTPNITTMSPCSVSSTSSAEVPLIAISVALTCLFLASLVVNGVLFYKWPQAPKPTYNAEEFKLSLSNGVSGSSDTLLSTSV